jgi:hypothetical protein
MTMPSTTKKFQFKTIQEAEKHFGGTANTLEALSAFATNQAARTAYNAEKNELLKFAKQLVKDGKLQMPPKA